MSLYSADVCQKLWIVEGRDVVMKGKMEALRGEEERWTGCRIQMLREYTR
jgi:hypothetical protein